MSSPKVAVVTGANKGIGFAIVKGLCQKFQGTIYLTARSVDKGEKAVIDLKSLGYNPVFHQLDITDETSVNRFKEHLRTTHGGIDILINNAGIIVENKPLEELANETVNVNYFGTLRVCEALFTLLRQNAKVVNISSSAGLLKRIPSADLRAKLSAPTLSINELNALMKKFLKDAKENRLEEEGWAVRVYADSKVAVTALTFVQQRNFDREQPNRNISVNAVHPGWVKTDINHNSGPLTAEEGAEAPLFVALEADFKGQYVWNDKTIKDWAEFFQPTHFPKN